MSLSFATRLNCKEVLEAYISGKTSNLVAELLTTFPANPTSASTRADLTIATGGSYTPQTLGGVTGTATNDGNGAYLDCNDPTWTGLYCGSATTIKGLAILHVPSSPASGDKVICLLRRVASATVASVTTTNGSATITSSAAFGSVLEGHTLEGAGIPAGAYVVEKVDSSTIRMSAKATAGATITLTYYAASDYTPATSAGSAENLSFTIPSIGFLKYSG